MTEPEQLEPSDSDQAALEGDLHSLTDDEYFEHLEAAKAAGVVGVDDEGREYQLDEGVRDERGRS